MRLSSRALPPRPAVPSAAGARRPPRRARRGPRASSSRTRRASSGEPSRSPRAARVIVRASAWASVDDRVGLAPGLVLQLVSRALRGDERRAQQRLELAIALELGLELLDAIRVVGPLAPDRLEALGDLLEQPVDVSAAVAEQASPELDVADLDWCVRHGFLLSSCSWSSSLTTTWSSATSTMTATIGERSIGPSDGRTRRKSRRYGLADVVEEALEPVQRVGQPDPRRQDVERRSRGCRRR